MSLGRSDEFLKATIFNSIASIMNYPFIFIGIEYFLVSLIFSNFIKIIINIFYLKKELDVTFSFFIRNTLIYISTAFVVAVLVEFTFPIDYFQSYLLLLILKSLYFTAIFISISQILGLEAFKILKDKFISKA